MKRTEWNETCSLAPCNHAEVDAPVLTPLERLEAWLEGRIDLRVVELRTSQMYSCILKDWSAREWGWRFVGYGTGPTLDEAILAALAQAEER